jgi:S1-C subfamily serine protease
VITADLAKQQDLPVSTGALVRGSSDGPAVEPGSPAAKAGIQAEDIILKVNGQQIDTNHTLSDLIAEHNAGDTVTLTVNRGGKEMTIAVTLGKRPATN